MRECSSAFYVGGIISSIATALLAGIGILFGKPRLVVQTVRVIKPSLKVAIVSCTANWLAFLGEITVIS